MSKYWVELRDIDIFYKEIKILNSINLKLGLGENTVIIGQNGSGKSTLLKVIAKLKYPLAKENSFIKHLGSSRVSIWHLRKNISFVLSELDKRIKDNMKISNIILSGYQGTFGLVNPKLITKTHQNKLKEIINLLDIKNIDKKYCNLSDGQKRRVLIARAIVNDPKVLVLDEPTSMLDLKAKYQLLQCLSKLANQGITILYVTNDIESIIKETNRIIFIKNGNILLDGEPNQLINSDNLSSLYDFPIEVRNKDGFWRTFPIQ